MGGPTCLERRSVHPKPRGFRRDAVAERCRGAQFAIGGTVSCASRRPVPPPRPVSCAAQEVAHARIRLGALPPQAAQPDRAADAAPTPTRSHSRRVPSGGLTRRRKEHRVDKALLRVNRARIHIEGLRHSIPHHAAPRPGPPAQASRPRARRECWPAGPHVRPADPDRGGRHRPLHVAHGQRQQLRHRVASLAHHLRLPAQAPPGRHALRPRRHLPLQRRQLHIARRHSHETNPDLQLPGRVTGLRGHLRPGRLPLLRRQFGVDHDPRPDHPRRRRRERRERLVAARVHRQCQPHHDHGRPAVRPVELGGQPAPGLHRGQLGQQHHRSRTASSTVAAARARGSCSSTTTRAPRASSSATTRSATATRG